MRSLERQTAELAAALALELDVEPREAAAGLASATEVTPVRAADDDNISSASGCAGAGDSCRALL